MTGCVNGLSLVLSLAVEQKLTRSPRAPRGDALADRSVVDDRRHRVQTTPKRTLLRHAPHVLSCRLHAHRLGRKPPSDHSLLLVTGQPAPQASPSTNEQHSRDGSGAVAGPSALGQTQPPARPLRARSHMEPANSPRPFGLSFRTAVAHRGRDPRGAYETDAIVQGVSELRRPGHTKRRQLDRQLGDGETRKAVVSSGARGRLHHAYAGRVDGVTALRCNRQRHRRLPRPDAYPAPTVRAGRTR